MENIFDLLVNYGSWTKTAEREFNQAELDRIASATVVEGQFRPSVCFTMKAGGKSYMGLSPYSKLAVGDTVDLSKAKIVTLSKPGEKDIRKLEA